MGIKFIGVKFSFKEGAVKFSDWAKKYALPVEGQQKFAQLCSLAVMKTMEALIAGKKPDYTEVEAGFQDWAMQYALSEKSIDDLVDVCDFILELTGPGGTVLELFDGKIFKYLIGLLKEALFKKKMK